MDLYIYRLYLQFPHRIMAKYLSLKYNNWNLMNEIYAFGIIIDALM